MVHTDPRTMLCPDNLDDMMVIVRELRQQRLNIMHNYSIQEPTTTTNNNLNNISSSNIRSFGFSSSSSMFIIFIFCFFIKFFDTLFFQF